MNKEKKYYLISWILLLALFNIICFVTPSQLYGFDKYAGGFWPGYGFIMLTFVIHLAFTMNALGAGSREKRILNAPLIVIGFMELLIMVIAGGVCMAVPGISYWVGIIVCAAILVLSIVFMMTAKVAGENAVAANQALNAKVSFMRELQAEAETLVSLAAGDAKASATKIVDALKYSDPVLDPDLAGDEEAIKAMIQEINLIIGNEENLGQVEQKTEDLLKLIEIRNVKARNNKRNKT